MTILYEAKGNLYVNLTNKCPCACVFCLRQARDSIGDSGSLWLEREPTVEEVKEAFRQRDMERYGEVVFCGFGEPTERLEDVIELAKHVKEMYNKTIRINTNGLSDLIHGKDTTPLFKDAIDIVSISLNTPSAARFYELTKSRFGEESFQGMLTFAKNVSKYVDKVIFSTVATTLSEEEEAECRRICDELGVIYRIRPFGEI